MIRLLVCLIILAGCSNRQVYESVRINRMHHCIPKDDVQRDLCLQKYEMTFEEYERLRNEALKDNESP